MADNEQKMGLQEFGRGLMDLSHVVGTGGTIAGVRRTRADARRKEREAEIGAARLERNEASRLRIENSPIVQGVRNFSFTRDEKSTLDIMNKDRKVGDKWTKFAQAPNGDLTLTDEKGGTVKIPIQSFINGLLASSPIDAIKGIAGNASGLSASAQAVQKRFDTTRSDSLRREKKGDATTTQKRIDDAISKGNRALEFDANKFETPDLTMFETQMAIAIREARTLGERQKIKQGAVAKAKRTLTPAKAILKADNAAIEKITTRLNAAKKKAGLPLVAVGFATDDKDVRGVDLADLKDDVREKIEEQEDKLGALKANRDRQQQIVTSIEAAIGRIGQLKVRPIKDAELADEP